MPAVLPAAHRRSLSASGRPLRARTFASGFGTLTLLIGAVLPLTGHAVDFGVFFPSDGGDTISVGDGNYELTSGTLTSRVQLIGRNGSAVLVQSGGTNKVTAVLVLGSNTGDSGIYSLTGGALETKEFLIGQQGRGVFRHSGGSIRASDLMRVRGSDSSYQMTGSGAVLNALGGIRVFEGSFSQAAGLVLGNLELWSGQVTHSGGHRTGTTTQLDGLIRHSGGRVTGGLDLQDGTYRLSGGTLAGDVLMSGGLFEQHGGAIVGNLRITGGRYTNSGALSSISGRVTLEAGDFQIGGNTVLGNGLDNRAAIAFFQGSLTVNGAGLRNSGSMWFFQTVDGDGAMVNDGLITTTRQARIAGSGGFTNNGTISLYASDDYDPLTGAPLGTVGRLRLANTGVNRNSGQIRLPQAATTLTLDGDGITLQNSGTIEMVGATIDGAGRLSGLASGRVSGFGTVSSLFDSEGQLTVTGGTMNVTRGMLNRGTIDVAANGAMSGGSIDNRGLMVVRGRVANAIVNTGAVRMAVDGVDPGFDSLFTNQASGVLWTGRETRPSGVPSRTAWLYGGILNRGRVEVDTFSTLDGGTIDNRGTLLLRGHLRNAIENTGLIHGGARPFDGSNVYGTVVNKRGGILRVGDEFADELPPGSEPWMAFRDRFENQSGGRIEVVRGGILRFENDLVLRSGSVLSLAGYRPQIFRGRVLFENGVILEGGDGVKSIREGGTMMFVDPDVRVRDPGSLIFAPGGTLAMSFRAAASGIVANHLDVEGSLLLTGGTLSLAGAGMAFLDAGDRFDLLDFGVVEGRFAAIDTRFAPLRAGLGWDFSDLYRTGEVAVVAVPEPATWASLGTGIVLLAGWRATSIRRLRRQNR